MTLPRKRRPAKSASAFDAFGRDVFGLLADCRIDFLVIGGLAVIARGVPRTTADVDVIAFASEEALVALLDEAIGRGFAAKRDEEIEALRTTGTLRFRRDRLQLDVIAASLPFEERARRRAPKVSLFGVDVPLPTVEDLLTFKVLAGRDKDLVDAVRLVERNPHLRLDDSEATVREVADYAEDPSLIERLRAVIIKAGC